MLYVFDGLPGLILEFKTSNSYKTLLSIGKPITTLNSYIGFNRTPQWLKVNLAQFNDLLNNNA